MTEIEKPTFESRLEEIRWLLSPFEGDTQCDCEQCTAGRQLLAVVDAVVADGTVESCAKMYRAQARDATEPFWHEYCSRIAEHLEVLL